MLLDDVEQKWLKNMGFSSKHSKIGPNFPLSTEAPFLGFHSPYLLVRYPRKLGECVERG